MLSMKSLSACIEETSVRLDGAVYRCAEIRKRLSRSSKTLPRYLGTYLGIYRMPWESHVTKSHD